MGLRKTASRPLYGEFAWAYDLLIDPPVRRECRTIATWLVERRVLPGAAVLDAGCGTGRYAIELARRGYVVSGVDVSPDLIARAQSSAANMARPVSFTVSDILALPASQYDAILCRGVLDDLVVAGDRQSVFRVFRRALKPEGVLVLDVCEWHGTAERRVREPLFRKSVATERGTLTFISVTDLDMEGRRLLVTERYVLEAHGRERERAYESVSQGWTREELDGCFRRAGFGRITYFGAYTGSIAAGATDRLVAVAQPLRTPAWRRCGPRGTS
jgi:SAM-dependent methyltransferase